MSELRILGLSGSLRRGSLNTRLLRSASRLTPPGVGLDVYDYAEVPLFNSDLMVDGALPPAVVSLNDAIRGANAVLIATPEYNYGIPGPLKNALDWASRPAYQSVFAGKPTAILGASPGVVGTARAQGQLKQVLLGMVAEVFPYPEVLVGSASARFDDEGSIVDEATVELLTRFVAAFVQWAQLKA